jgi:hypothetical protein
MGSLSRKRVNTIALLLLLTISGLFLVPLLNRPIWFDEAWSIMVYTTLPYSKIYLSYGAPNNHILLNILLKFWLDITGGLFPLSEVTFRLFSLLTSLTIVSLMFLFWRKRLGLYATFLTVLCFTVSTPFLIYGTAIRGYMLSLIFVLCGLESGLRFIESGRKKYALLYFLSALAGIAVIPSNIFVFAIIAIFPPKARGFRFDALLRFIKERWLLAILPFAGLVLFYGPIWKKLYSAIKNNNGWLHPYAAVEHLYAALLLTLLPVILYTIIARLIYKKRYNKFQNKESADSHPGSGNRHNQKNYTMTNILIFIIFAAPALLIISRKPAPFPRVFFQMWPIWLFLAGTGVKRLPALIRSTGMNIKRTRIPFIISTLIVVWGISMQLSAPQLSLIFTRKFSQDDFFQPCYMKKNFTPLETVKSVIKLTGSQKQRVFLSHYSDFPSLIFYGKLKGLTQDFWITDYPGKNRLKILPKGEKYYFVVKNQQDFSFIKTRFKLKNTKIIKENLVQNIYEANYGN